MISEFQNFEKRKIDFIGGRFKENVDRHVFLIKYQFFKAQKMAYHDLNRFAAARFQKIQKCSKIDLQTCK